jgi:hypothetical protein
MTVLNMLVGQDFGEVMRGVIICGATKSGMRKYQSILRSIHDMCGLMRWKRLL